MSTIHETNLAGDGWDGSSPHPCSMYQFLSLLLLCPLSCSFPLGIQLKKNRPTRPRAYIYRGFVRLPPSHSCRSPVPSRIPKKLAASLKKQVGRRSGKNGTFYSFASSQLWA